MTRHTKQSAITDRHRLRAEHVVAFRRALRGPLAKELAAGQRAASNLSRFRRWIAEFYPAHEAALIASLGPLVERIGDEVSSLALREVESDARPPVAEFAETYTDALALRWTDSSIAQLRQILRDEADALAEIDDRFDQWSERRPQATAEREATQANGAFAKLAFLTAGVSTLVWRAFGESCALCSELDGKVIGITASFLGKGDTLTAGDTELTTPHSIGHPPLHGMGGRGGVCDCMVVAG